MKIKIIIITFLAIALVSWNCTVSASFSEGKIYGETFAIGTFPNKAALVQPAFSQELIDGLRTKIINESNLKFTEDCYSSSYYFTGSITNYAVSPLSATSGNVAAANRLSVSVNVQCDSVCPTKFAAAFFFAKSYSEYADFGTDETFASAEERLMKEIVTKITQQVYLDLLSASTAKKEKEENKE
jgi:hypothetical protein